MQAFNRRIGFSLFLAATLLSALTLPAAQAAVTKQTGSFADGATYLIEVPSPWNGTLLLYSHGYVGPGGSNPATDVGDPLTRAFLLTNGFALAGSSYAHTGWAIQEALVDQIEVLDTFNAMFGKPKRTIAWGHSLGGIITAGLIQRNPGRFDAALPMCGVLSGGVATWNQALDGAFAFKTFFNFGGPLQVVNIGNPIGNLALSEALLSAAQATPQGRARIGLIAALGDTPGWFDPASPEPAANDFASQETNQFLWFQQIDFPFIFALRAELEARAGGNPSWNTRVDYFEQFENSVSQAEVRALYKEAGLDLEDDLEALNRAARISADPASVDYLEQNIFFDGDLDLPVLTLHTTGDGLVVHQNEAAYRNAAREGGSEKRLRQIFVHRAGHCTFTPAETLTALTSLMERLDSGHWPDLRAATLNTESSGLGPLNIAPPAFIPFASAPFLRPFDAFIDRRCERRGGNEQTCKVDPDGEE